MPILWRSALIPFIKTFLLALSSFILILLVMRSQDIAKFALIAETGPHLVLFILYQIPTIFPICLPISVFVATTYVVGRSCQFGETIALLTSGISLVQIRRPLLYMVIFLSALNFYFVSQLTPKSKIGSKDLLTSIIRANPLLLLTKRYLIDIKDITINMDPIQIGKVAENFYCGFYDSAIERIRLIHAKKIYMDKKDFMADQLLLCFYSKGNIEESFDNLFMDNIEHTRTDPSAFSLMSTTSSKKASLAEKPTSELIYNLTLKETKKKSSIIGEISKRLYFSCAVFSLFLLAFYSNITTSRYERKKALIFTFILFILIFAGFLIGRSLYKHPALSLISYSVPHLFVFLYARLQHERIIHGAL